AGGGGGGGAIDRGYGLLSENAAFAESCARAGLTFVGPPAAAMRAAGSKTAARRLARETGVPMVPGTVDPVASDADAERAAREIGYPVMLKAAMGGGGKGMRLVRRAEELPEALRAAPAEAGPPLGHAPGFF